MITNNKFNLPEALFNALSWNYKPKKDHYSVTQLIDSPIIRTLTIEHWDEIEEDVSEGLWRLLGSAMDSILTKNAPRTWVTQDKILIPLWDRKIIIVAKKDYYDTVNKILGDWKATTVWQYIFGGRNEWAKQLNCYAWAENIVYPEREIKQLVAQRLFRDWNKREAQKNSDYPPMAFMPIEIPLWPKDQHQAYIDSRIKLHLEEPYKICSPEERWEKPNVWAVKKKGNETAKGGKLCDSENEAQEFISQNADKKWEIEFRPGECIRCSSYCKVNKWCPFWQERQGTK